MAFEWHSFVELARKLAEEAESATSAEAWRRSALSRAYFGAYGHARNYATDFLFFAAREDVDDHGRLRAHLRDKRRSGDSRRLDRLRQLRNVADYANKTAANLLNEVTEAHELAERVFQSLAPPK